MEITMGQFQVGTPEVISHTAVNCPDWSIIHQVLENARRHGLVSIILGMGCKHQDAMRDAKEAQDVLKKRILKLAYPGEEIIVQAAHSELLPDEGGWLVFVYSRLRIPTAP